MSKVLNARNAGAIGVLVYNNVATGLPGMGGTDATVTIPSQGISQADGNTIITALASGAVTATLDSTVIPSRDPTVDNLIVAHEWGPQIRHRLIDDALGLDTKLGRSLADGWPDFLALLLAVQDAGPEAPNNEQFSGVYAQGGCSAMGPLMPTPH